MVVLGDLGLSTALIDKFERGQKGTKYYYAPEVWKIQKFNTITDIFSVGAMLFHLRIGDFMIKYPGSIDKYMREFDKG